MKRLSTHDEIVGEWEVFIQQDYGFYRYLIISQDFSFIGINGNIAIPKRQTNRSTAFFYGENEEVTEYHKSSDCSFQNGVLTVPMWSKNEPQTLCFNTVVQAGAFSTIFGTLDLQPGDILVGETHRLPPAPPGRIISPPAYREYLLRRLRTREQVSKLAEGRRGMR